MGTGYFPSQNAAVRRRKPVRWLPILAILGILLASGTVLADVVLSYSAENGLGANATSPFLFQNGGNYAAAHSLGIATNAYASGTSGPTVTTTISGVVGVPVEAYNVTQLATGTTIPAATTFGNVLAVNPSTLTPTNVVCAYAFVSTAAPSPGTTGVSGAPTGCSATVPTLGLVSTGCGTHATAQVATINLLTGAINGSIATSGCTVASGTASGVIVLYVSYAVTTSGAVTATSLNTFQVPVNL